MPSYKKEKKVVMESLSCFGIGPKLLLAYALLKFKQSSMSDFYEPRETK